MSDVNALREEMEAAGAWVFAAGLHPAGTATVLRLQDGDVLTTDGPFVEGKEHLGGFSIIRTPNLDSALEWGRKLARATTLPVEVRLRVVVTFRRRSFGELCRGRRDPP